jgi:hypothetical protein
MDRSIIDLLTSIGVLCGTSAVATNALTLPAVMTSTASGVVLLMAGLLVSTLMPMTGISLLILAIILFFRRNMNHTIQGTLRSFEAERAYGPTAPMYGESTIPLDRQGPQTPGYDSEQVEAREYTQNLGTLDVPSEHAMHSMNQGPLQAVDSIVQGIGSLVQGVGGSLPGVGGSLPGVGCSLHGFENPAAELGVGSQAEPVVDRHFLNGTDSTVMRAVEGFVPATIEQSAELNPPKGQYRTDESRETATPVAESYMYRPAADTGSNEFHRYGPQMDKKVDSFRYYA